LKIQKFTQRKNRNERRFVNRFFLLRLIIFSFVFLPFTSNAQYDAVRYPIIPKPYALLPYNGEFKLNSETVIVTDNRLYRNEIDYFRKQVKAAYGIDLKFTSKRVSENFIYISDDSTDIPNEGYNLFVVRNEIDLYGGHAGIFYGLQSLFQLVQPEKDSVHYDKDSNIVNIPGPRIRFNYQIPSCSIVDQPRFSWRGMHLDVARHFYPKEDVKKYLSYMAMYKLNTFHWHLTDDQGWRIEIKKYPKLTSVGAWRNGTLIGHEGEAVPRYDTIHYGGFYTQKDIREIVRFADSLHITIVPEIEMPGHSMAMLAAYPELGCTAGPFSVSTTWGVFEDVLCPTEKTFSFLDDVLKEVCALFPGKYIHIGGDECPKAKWKASAFCQDLMKKNNLKTEDELQSWFTQRIVKMLQQKGKEAIGWDEILEGGLADGAAVMSWRGEEGGIAAAKAKHNVVMSPGGYCYFDHYQSLNPNEPLAIGGFLPLEKVYSYNPVPASLNEDEKKYIMGVQANVWTEYIPTFAQVQYMIFPRMCALAEVAWDEPVNMNYDFFVKRLMRHFDFMERMDVNYATSLFEPKLTRTSAAGGNGVMVSLSSPIKGATFLCNLRTFTDLGFDPIVMKAWKYSGPFELNNSGNYTDAKGYTELHIYVLDSTGLQKFSTIYKFTLSTSSGKNIQLKIPPSKSYNTGGAFTLVDGKVGELPWRGSDYLGWLGDTMNATIDLGKDSILTNVTVWWLNDPGSWIYRPESYTIEISEDGKTFKQTHGYPLDTAFAPFSPKASTQGTFTSAEVFGFPKNTKARYIRIIATPKPKIPQGNPGEGNKTWLFISEIEVE
jgi:hexosaminidase